ncbi:MAG TPA: alpha-hydroxy-acid oxidizing protein [Aeromicrobium sp.]|nr:alpha-hydroxy-acid oxidizing protein [Aeromicrobium sp.]
MPNFADFNLGIYLNGLGGQKPALPLSYEELELRAKECLGDVLYDYVAGGAGNEQTQRDNVSALARWGIVPRMLAGVAERDLSIELFGRQYPSPLMMAPIGVVGVMHASGHGDIEVARAAAATSVPMIGSTLMQDPLEDVFAQAGNTPSFFQLYTPNDRELAESFVARAVAAGVAGIVVTLDTWTLGWRPRDLRHAAMPQLQGQCLANYFSDPVFRSRLDKSPEDDPVAATYAWASVFGSPELSWDDLPWLRGLTDLPILLKGICHPDDVRRARDLGVDGIYCSTHGGRQAVSAPAIGFLPGVVEAADGLPVIFDSGVRTGVDVVRALALGATAVAVGRPYGWGITLDGAAGAEFVLRSLLAEADLTMGLNGYRAIADLGPSSLIRT